MGPKLVSLLCVAQHANVQLACCSNLNLHTILRLRVDSSFETLTCTALGPNRRFSSEFAFWAIKPKFETRCGVFLRFDNRVCLRGHVGTTRRAQRRRISPFPFVGRPYRISLTDPDLGAVRLTRPSHGQTACIAMRAASSFPLGTTTTTGIGEQPTQPFFRQRIFDPRTWCCRHMWPAVLAPQVKLW